MTSIRKSLMMNLGIVLTAVSIGTSQRRDDLDVGPREDNSGRPFRQTPAAKILKQREIEVMCAVATELGIGYKVL